MAGYDDPNNKGNSPKYYTGKLCIEGCGRPAGTAWSPFWCFECNVKRINGINSGLDQIIHDFQKARADAAKSAARLQVERDAAVAQLEGQKKLIANLQDCYAAKVEEAKALREAIQEYLEWGAMTGSDRDLFENKFRAVLAHGWEDHCGDESCAECQGGKA